jgi:kynurenine formamidase
MCHACVTDEIKRRMLSRRDLLRAAPVAVAMGAGLGALPALAQGASRVVDMTHTLSPEFPTFFGVPGVSMTQKFNWNEHKFNLFEMTVNEHTGTHVDAPLHFSADGASVDEIAPQALVCPLAVIDIRAKAAANADAQVTPDDVKAWTDAHGPVPDGACVAMNSGWGAKVGDPAFRGAGADQKLHFPGFHIEAAQMLLETGAVAMAVDSLSLDHGPSPDFAVHYAWLPTGRYGIECVAGLDAVPPAGATLVVGAPKHRGGSGGPARVLALV